MALSNSETFTAMGKISILGFLDDILSHLICLEADRSQDRKELANRLLKILPTICSENGADLNLEQLRKAAMFSRAYLEIIYDHFHQFSKFRVEEQISILQISYGWNPFEKTAKWVFSAPMAKHLRQEELADGLPPRPSADIHLFPFSSPIRKYFGHIVRSRKYKKNLHFFTSLLLGGKRACAEPSDEMIKSSLESHAKTLSKEPEQLKFKNLRSYLHRALMGASRFKSGPLKDTGGASYLTTRSMGGKFEEVVRRFNGCTLMEPIHNSCLYYMDSRGRTLYGREIPSYADIRSQIGEMDNVKAIGLLEALKVRIITTGDAAMSVYLEKHRKQIHDFLRKISCLKALGAPKITESDLADLREKESNLGLNFPWWVSGDYSAATDNLNMAVTKQAIEEICQAIGCEGDIGLMMSSLTGTHLNYPSHPEIESREQKNGQLMGNPMSFPILCLANLAGYWASLEQYLQRPVDINDLPVLINGDDILFRADGEFLSLWRDKIKSLGFSLSIGKYYVHPRVATLNSQFFLDQKEIGYYNPGLLFKGFAGNKKKAQFLPIEAISDELLRGAYNKQRAFARFKHYWGSTLDLATDRGRLNLFLPRSAGGLGGQPYGLVENVDYYISEANKRLAYSLHRLQNHCPIQAEAWTNCPMRENLNCHNSICDNARLPKRAIWMENDPRHEDYQILLKRGLHISPHKKEIELKSFACLEPHSDQTYPSFQMGVPVMAGEPLWLPIGRISPSAGVIPSRFELDAPLDRCHSPSPIQMELPSLDRLDFEDYEKKIITLPPGAFRMDRSFDPKIEARWYRRISQRDRRWLYATYPPPKDLPDPVERKLRVFSGKINPISSSI